MSSRVNGQGSDALCSLSVRLLMVRGGSKRQRVSAAYWFITFGKRGVAMTLIK